jgi:hypothetical protein
MAGLVLRILVVAIVVLAAGPVLADDRVAYLAERLRYPPPSGEADDFRVRTNAALALGATSEDGAIAPLCAGLDDPSEVVRQAVALALKRLARSSSAGCLHKRAAVEQSSSVKLQIQHAIEAIDAAGGAGAGTTPAIVPAAKFYVAISPITNGTTRPDAEVDRLVHDAIASKLTQLGEYQLAPAGGSGAAAKTTIARRKLKGYVLAVRVDRFDYSDGGLRVRMTMAISSYPGKDLRGELPAGATLPGARPGDKSAEDQLVRVVAERATELFAQNFR